MEIFSVVISMLRRGVSYRVEFVLYRIEQQRRIVVNQAIFGIPNICFVVWIGDVMGAIVIGYRQCEPDFYTKFTLVPLQLSSWPFFATP